MFTFTRFLNLQPQPTKMQRVEQRFLIHNPNTIKTNLLLWANNYTTVAWLDSNKNANHKTDGLLALGKISHIKTNYHNAFHKLKKYVNGTNDYAFGFLGYDLKNDTEALTSQNMDAADFPDLYFFQPEKIIEISEDAIYFRYPKNIATTIAHDWQEIQTTQYSKDNIVTNGNLNIQNRTSKETYTQQVNKALEHIHLGKVYELNFCQEFYAENATINPLSTYLELNKISTAPFASYLKFDDHYLLSASPERFLKKVGTKVFSSPIKGTAKRENDPLKDIEQKRLLKNNTKEIAENIMIVDLVRNDLSHIAKKGSVNVDELCEIHSFKQVHQMISTISCEVENNTHAVDIIKACYPMGSMTGAPKIAAMELIESLENFKRGIYSGAVGYFTPTQDFDFNVVIRSIAYNQKQNYVSFAVGSAITAKANPEQEYEECLLKAKAMRKVLTS